MSIVQMVQIDISLIANFRVHRGKLSPLKSFFLTFQQKGGDIIFMHL